MWPKAACIPRAAKEALAHEMVSRYHSGKDADEARQGFNAVFADGGVPADAPSLSCQYGEDSTPPAFLEAARGWSRAGARPSV